MRQIRLHDTRRGGLAPLEPREPGRVGIYVCGPTVYARIHVGNARPYVVFSLLKRFLEHEGFEASFVVNVTDVNDKIYDAAREAGVASADLAAEMTAHYRSDTDRLGLGRPDHEPLASETIEAMVDHIAVLIERDAAYAVDGDVYFRVRRDPGYGTLSHRDVDDMDQGEGEGLSRKRDALDFALWKAQKPGEDTAWEAPWGRGRPGWHIECSAMAETLLGLDFEVHGGGNDLTFPHHENEAAQTRAARDVELARIWMHNGMLQFGGEKMAKSVGNTASLPEVLERWGRDAFVLLIVAGHYRQPLIFDEAGMEQATASVRRLREAGRRLVDGPSPQWSTPLLERAFTALADDFSTPAALAAAFDWVREANRAADAGEAVGRDDLRALLWALGLENLLEDELPVAPEAVVGLAAARARAREQRDFTAADRLRDELAVLGWEVRDGAGDPELRPLA